MTVPFLFHSVVSLPNFRRPRLCLACKRTRPHANINKTNNSERENEIAAKVAKLRNMKGLNKKHESPKGPEGDTGANIPKEIATGITSFADLPDWKKEEILQRQMAEAEAFLKPESGTLPSSTGTADNADGYKPKVSTWGVFPRPGNISRTFGGGKRIAPGGVDLSKTNSQEQDALTAQKLAAYRTARGIDLQKEEAHAEEIEAALHAATQQMTRSRPDDAVLALQAVEAYVSERSRRGGKVFLALALAYEAVGKRDEARKLYRRLRRSPFPEVSGKAKHLLQGFEAMDMLKVEDETREKGFRVTKFTLPDVSAGAEKRYETALGGAGSGGKSASIDARTSLLLLLLIVGPVAFVVLVLSPASR